MSQIRFQQFSFRYPGADEAVFQDLTLCLDTDWKLALAGRNGRGKTTLLRLLSGDLPGGAGLSCPVLCRYFPAPAGAGADGPAMEHLRRAAPEAEEWTLLREAAALGLGQSVLDRPWSTLSGGERTRCLLAALFAGDGYPLLDEPTDHLDREGRALVARYLQRTRQGFLLVSHDQAFLDACTDHTLALNQTGAELIHGSFSAWLEEKQARDRGELAQNEALRGEIGRLQQAARRTAHWSDQVEKRKYGVKNSGLRPDRGYLGHKSAKMMKRAKHLEQRQEAAIAEKSALLRDVERDDPLTLSPLPWSGGPLLEGRELSLHHDADVFCQIPFLRLEPGERLRLDGPNGCGKSSLLRLAAGEPVPHTGVLRRPSGLVISYVPQEIGGLRGTPEELARELGLDRTQLMTVLRKLHFPRPLLRGELSRLSAGQAKKILLAVSLCQRAHLYLWDEPLNYLDLWSRLQLRELVLAFRPTLLFVEHDEAFAQAVATRTLSLSPR